MVRGRIIELSELQAEHFLKDTGTEFSVKYLKHGLHFEDDKDERDIYEITLERGRRAYTFKFGQSTAASGAFFVWTGMGKKCAHDRKEAMRIAKHTGVQIEKNKNFSEPSAYDVLACLQKNEVGTFADFCADFGYDEDSRKAEKIYKAVCEEHDNLKMLYSDAELAKMAEII